MKTKTTKKAISNNKIENIFFMLLVFWFMSIAVVMLLKNFPIHSCDTGFGPCALAWDMIIIHFISIWVVIGWIPMVIVSLMVRKLERKL